MKPPAVRLSICTFIITLIILALGSQASAQQYPVADELHTLLQTIKEKHVRPRTLSLSFLNESASRFPQSLDPDHMLFLEAEIQDLQNSTEGTPPEIEKRLADLLKKIIPLYKNAVTRVNKSFTAASAAKIDWATSEDFTPSPVSWSKTESDLQERWRLWIKYHILLNLQEYHAPGAKSQNNLSFVQRVEKELKEKAVTQASRTIQHMATPPGGIESHLASIFLKTVASQFDPHTDYFSAREMENFIGSLSDENLSFGLHLKELDNGDITIEHLTPGGPAWKSGELHRKDILIKIQSQGQPSINLEGIGMDEFIEILDNSSNNISFTVRKSNGILTTVSLQKEKIYADENIVKGFFLQQTNNIGYISLPDFYSDWKSEGARGCANDVAKEIIKMKKENIQGLILDLRSNGGGSLQEAVDMAGIFIDEGPMLLAKDKTGKVFTIRDLNRGVIYNGPLVVLVNAQSASASELLASTLQDYSRAIIVGGRTFGKSTAQSVEPLHPATNTSTSAKSKQSFAKITDLMIYRVTLKSIQAKGVVPDIKLPDVYDLPVIHEQGLQNVLTVDSITKNVVFQKLNPLPTAELQTKSLQRTKDNSYFNTITSFNKQLADMLTKQQSSISLSWSNFIAPATSYTEISNETPSFKASWVTPPDTNTIDAFEKQYYDLRLSELEKDYYLAEAYQILNDLIQK